MIERCLTLRWLLSPFWHQPHQSWPQTRGRIPPAQTFQHFNIQQQSSQKLAPELIRLTEQYMMWSVVTVYMLQMANTPIDKSLSFNVNIHLNVFQLTRNRGRPLVPLAKETASVVSDASGLWDQGTPCCKRYIYIYQRQKLANIEI